LIDSDTDHVFICLECDLENITLFRLSQEEKHRLENNKNHTAVYPKWPRYISTLSIYITKNYITLLLYFLSISISGKRNKQNALLPLTNMFCIKNTTEKSTILPTFDKHIRQHYKHL